MNRSEKIEDCLKTCACVKQQNVLSTKRVLVHLLSLCSCLGSILIFNQFITNEYNWQKFVFSPSYVNAKFFFGEK